MLARILLCGWAHGFTHCIRILSFLLLVSADIPLI
nr:MAG TPA: Protein of unknown function (DUF2785) [Bacteriophage sp.]